MVEEREVPDVVKLITEIITTHALNSKVNLGPLTPTDYTYEELIGFLNGQIKKGGM